MLRRMKPGTRRHARRLALEHLERRDVPSFAATTVFPLGGDDGEGLVAVEHLNGDGHLDIVVVSEFNDTANVFLGTGEGKFAPAQTFDTFGNASGFAIGDINGDDAKDLVIAIGLWASVMLSDGAGNFQPPWNWHIGHSVYDVALGDFDSDADLDVAIAGSSTVTILLNAGNGIFATPATYPGGANSRSLAVADFDADSDLDIVVANYNAGGTVSVLKNHGNGSFAAPKRFRTNGSAPRTVAVGNFNNDGIPDFAVTNKGNDTLGVLLSHPTGIWTPKAYAAGSVPWGISTGDFDADGDDDLVVTNNKNSGEFRVFQNVGDGTFQTSAAHSTSFHPRAVAVGDFDADGNLDLTYTAGANALTGTLHVVRGNGDGTLRATLSSPAGTAPRSVAAGDLDEDGDLDIVAGNFSYQNPGTVSVLLGHGNGMFDSPTSFPSGGLQVYDVEIEDFDRDGHLDVALTNHGSDTVGVLLGNGDGTLKPATLFAVGDYPFSLATRDFNMDGNADLAFTNHHSISVLLGIGDGTFQGAVSYPIGSHTAYLGVADTNGDGNLDLITSSTSNQTVSVLHGKSDGTFEPVIQSPAGKSPYNAQPGDFNGDGKMDVVVTGTGITSNHGVLRILLGNGDGTFLLSSEFPALNNPRSLVVSDFNADGRLDVAFVTYCVSVFLGQGDGTFLPGISYDSGGADPFIAAVADFDDNGFADLALPHNYSDNVGVLLNDGNWPVPVQPIRPRSQEPVAPGTPFRRIERDSSGLASAEAIHISFDDAKTERRFTQPRMHAPTPLIVDLGSFEDPVRMQIHGDV